MNRVTKQTTKGKKIMSRKRKPILGAQWNAPKKEVLKLLRKTRKSDTFGCKDDCVLCQDAINKRSNQDDPYNNICKYCILPECGYDLKCLFLHQVIDLKHFDISHIPCKSMRELDLSKSNEIKSALDELIKAIEEERP